MERSGNPVTSRTSYFPPSSATTQPSHRKPWFPQSILSYWKILQDRVSAFQSCTTIPCLLYQYSKLTSPEIAFFCLFWVNKLIFMEVQAHSWFLMLSYFVRKFLSSGIRSLCSMKLSAALFFPSFISLLHYFVKIVEKTK